MIVATDLPSQSTLHGNKTIYGCPQKVVQLYLQPKFVETSLLQVDCLSWNVIMIVDISAIAVIRHHGCWSDDCLSLQAEQNPKDSANAGGHRVQLHNRPLSVQVTVVMNSSTAAQCRP